MRPFIITGAALLLFAPTLLYAQGIVPCSGIDCQACHLLQLIQNIINTAIYLASFIVIVSLSKTGFDMVVSGSENPLKHSALRRRLKNVVIGFTLMLGAWVIVDTAMKLFLKDELLGTWNKIQCAVQPTSTSDAINAPTVEINVPTVICAGCVSLAKLGITCKDPKSCYLKESAAKKIAALNNNYQLRVTEAWPPTVTHTNKCHEQATCVDATIANSKLSKDVIEFIQAAQKHGITAVYEGMSCIVRTEVRAVLGRSAAFCIDDSGFSHITGTHFSLYTE